MANPLLGVAGDLGRTFRERPAIVVGVGVLGLVGLTLLNRQNAAADEGADVDPAAGLFPGVDTYGGAVPGSGSVPFGGYPSAGGGGGFDLPSIGALPAGSSWECTDSGWQYVPPPPPVVNPPPGTSPAGGGLAYVIRISKGATVKLAKLRSDGKIHGWDDRKATVTASYQADAKITRKGASGASYEIARARSGPYAGRYVRLSGAPGVAYSRVR